MRREPFLLTLLFAVLLLVAGCGDGAADEVTETSTSAETTAGSEGGAVALSDDEAAVVAAVREYLGAIAEKDWSAVCDAASDATQRGLERTGGLPCEDAVAIIYDTPQFQNFAEAWVQREPESVVLTGDRAKVAYGPGQAFPLVREDDGWKFHEE